MITRKIVLPYIIAFVVFVILPVIYFVPQYQGLGIKKFDNVQATGMTAPIKEHQREYNEHPFWVANMFGGMPSYPISTDVPTDVIKLASKSLSFLGTPASFYFILMVGFFIMLCCFGVNPWLAIAGSIAYGFSTYFIIIYEAGHIMKLVAMCYIPPMIGALFYTYKKSFIIGSALFGAFTLLEISSVHPQITYYFLFPMLAMVVSFAIDNYKKKTLRHFYICSGALLLTSALAVGANSIYLYYTYDYSKDSTRGKSILTTNGKISDGGLDKDYITAWSYGKMETFNLFIPNLMGGKSNGGFSEDGEVSRSLKKYTNAREANSIATQLPGYWGPQPMTSGPVYIGAVMIFLFVLGLFLVKGVNKWWIVSASVLAILLAWGKHFMPLTDLFIDYFPLYNKFRTVSMILVVVELTVPLMAMLGLNEIWKGNVSSEKLKDAMFKSLYITGGCALFFALFGGAIFSFIGANDGSMGLPQDVVLAMGDERLSMLRSDAFRSLVFVALTFGAIYLWQNKKIKQNVFVGALALLVIADMVPVAFRHLNHDMFNVPLASADHTPMTAIDREILKDKDINYRVANMSVSTFNDATTSLYHRSVGGYFAAKPRRYQDMIDRYLSKMNMSVYNMLNTKYFILKGDDGAQQLMPNSSAFGNAWLAEDIVMVSTPNDEIAKVGEVNLANTAVISNEFTSLLTDVSLERNISDKIEHTSYKANRMEYKTDFSEPRLVIFSEIYYPKGWTATIDGKKTDYLRANYILNGLVVPAGEHIIVFEFKPPHLSALRAVSIISSLLLVLILAAGVYLNYKKIKIG